MELFEGRHAKVKQLDKDFAAAFGFKKLCPVNRSNLSAQNRYDDRQTQLALIAQSAHKVCNDLRLLANLKRMEEPVSRNPRSAHPPMAYKRNPMRCGASDARSPGWS
jgi:adenylosuccinate lyase